MGKNDGFNTETNKPGDGGFGPAGESTGGYGGSGESKRTEKSSATQNREFGSDRNPDLTERGEEFYDQAKKTVSDTCNKTTETLNKTYNQAIAYGRANPGKLALVALGSGLVIGLLLANRSKDRQGSYVEPVVNALSQGFSDFVRRHWG
jgi:ElaB/YqjD/DUF883 family membrane-anchored ribosome-binding protein